MLRCSSSSSAPAGVPKRAVLSSPRLGDITGPGSLYSPAILPQGASVDRSRDLTELTVLLVASFVSHNAVTAAELPGLIRSTYAMLTDLTASRTDSQALRPPAVPSEQSITRDYIVCLDDGTRLKTLRRYLKRKYSLTPEQYRERWGLPDDYPMVAPGYSELRSSLATRFAKRSRKG